ncbi:hypothetical protein E1265_30510 [Streptomyces sp. 8K308]|uniref:hypothetical protein n=1 Tax=Streptomyces sp. 8K308 TaxID=2530388 RepID=UPI001042D184|nr:hypothetical protein [Streptomyces sp. 8K308]TDC10964.1 hypothetical protein E1265_30510 [Streptomyces sp. 8K308]
MTEGSGESVRLGRLVAEHPVVGPPNRRFARTALAVGVLGVAIGVPLLILGFSGESGSRSNFVVGLPLGIGLAGLLLAWIGADGARRARDGEVFALHEGGLVHRRRGAPTTEVPWSDIARVRDTGRAGLLFARHTGRDVDCRIRLRDGRRLRVTGFTDRAAALSEAIRAATAERRP